MYLGVTSIHPNDLAGDLSVGQQQILEIARALSTKAKVIVKHAPTAALTDREIESLFKMVASIRKKGVGIIYISHRMEEIFEICDRITVLRDSEYIGVKEIPKTSFQEIVKMMVGRELGERFPLKDNDIGNTIFEVTDFERMGHFQNINFDVKQGEILGVAGLMGAGRTEIMEAIFEIGRASCRERV